MSIQKLKPRLRKIYGSITNTNIPKKNNKKKSRKQWIKPVIITGISLFVIFFIAGTIIIAIISKDLPDPEKLSTRQIAQSTKIYDRTGDHLLYEIYQDQKRTLIELEAIAPLAVKATIAVEDRHFYEHKGIRFLSIIRAAVNNLIGRRSGGGGASTLTQQLIKNAVVGNEHSYFRKIKEAILAIRLEKKYTKDQILKMYLNEIPYGSTNYGIESAAQSYFKKPAKDLSLAESATLAGLPKQPSRYLNNLDLLKDRRDLVLRLMFDQDYISKEEKESAQSEDLNLLFNTSLSTAPHFVLYVKQLLAEQFGEKMIDHAGLKVITSLDFDKQKIAEKVVKELGDKFAKEANADNAALVALDPKTGEILSMVGSRDYNNKEISGQFNVATLGKRQPGSSFKPFVYTAAFEKGYTPETVLYDVLTNFDRRDDGDYTPQNYTKQEYGLVTMRKALQGSLNISAVKTLYLVGIKTMSEFSERFGYTTLKNTKNYGLSLVLGGAEVTLLEHTNAYATLANNGRYNAPTAILKVYDNNDIELFSAKDAYGTEAVTHEVASLITSVLSDDSARAYAFGRGGNLTLPNRQVASKTGTTNNYKDAWTLGYTPSLTTGVWVGNTLPSPMKGGGNKLAGQIWNRFMTEVLENTSIEFFPEPPSNNAFKTVLNGGNGILKVKINRLNGKLATTSTPENLIREKEFLPPHNILHYIDKNDPRGLIPENPSNDTQYENWEIALQEWATRQQEDGNEISFSEPPNSIDDFEINSELAPTIKILTPINNSILTTRQLDIKIEAEAPRGISEVLFKINENTIGISRSFPFSLNYYLKNNSKGQHTLSIIASDDIGNSSIEEIVFDLQADIDPPGFIWFEQSPITITEDDFPRLIALTPFRFNDIEKIDIELMSTSGEKKLIYTFNKNDRLLMGKLNFTWNNSPGKGFYTLIGTMTDKNKLTSIKTFDIFVE